MAISNKPQQVGLSDPNLIRQTESKLAQSALIANGKPTIIGDTAVLPSTTVSATPTSVTTTTSANNQVADTTTVYQTNGTVYVSSIDQTVQNVVNKNIVNQIGVTEINAGNNITIVSSDGNGAGSVTINAVLPTYGNIAVINLDGNGSNVLYGNGYWSADLTTYGNIAVINLDGNGSNVLYGNGYWSAALATYSNSNVVSLMAAFGSNTIVTTGNAKVGNLISTGVIKVSSASAYFDEDVGYIQNGGTGEFQLSTANATQPLKISTNSASKNWFFYANGNMTAPGAVSVTGNITAGNVTGNYFIGNGSQLTSLPAPSVAQDITTIGDMSIMTYNGNLKYVSYATVEPSTGNLKAGNISTTGNITGGNIIGIIAAGSNAITTTGNITGGNITTGVITLTNGAVIKDTAGDAVVFGQEAGNTGQGTYAVAIGASAGSTTQGNNSVAIGHIAGQIIQGEAAVAIGYGAGYTGQGNVAVAIGSLAGSTNQGNNSIILNATGAALNQTVDNTFTVAPIRNDVSTANVAQVLFYNITSKEVTYGNVISVAGNITGANLMGALANGNSNVRIATANGNVTLTAVGNTTMTISGTGANITGTANISGNANVGNIGAATGIFSTAANTGLVQNGTSNVTIASGANVSVFTAGNATAQFIVTATGANIPGTANVTGNANVGNIGANNGVFTGNISGNTAGFAIGYLNIPQVAASNTTIALTDAGKHYYSTSAGNFTLTVPNNTTTSFATGTAISIVVQSAGNVLVNAATGVTLYMAGNSTSANRVVSNYGMATIMKVATDTWMINGTGVA